MINNLITMSFFKLLSVWLLLYITIMLLERYQRRLKSRYDLNILKEDVYLVREYLDQFYISNFFYTFFIGFIYFFSIVLVFLGLRYYYITNLVPLLRVENIYYNIILTLLSYVLIFITLILYKSLIYVICKKELNKIYIYLCPTNYEHNILNIKIGDLISGCLYIIFYRIGTLTYQQNMYPLFPPGQAYGESGLQYIVDGEGSDYHIYDDNETIVKILYKMLDLARKYPFLQKLFIVLAYIFRFINKHISLVYQKLPLFIFIMTLLYDIYNKELHYTFYISFILLVIQIKRNLTLYYEKRNLINDCQLKDYFYRNTVPYSKQRQSFNYNYKILDTKENNSVFSHHRSLKYYYYEFLEYIYNDFKYKNYDSSVDKKLLGIYRRFWVIVGSIILIYCIYINNNNYLCTGIHILYICLILLIFMIYYHLTTYYVSEFELWHQCETRIYNQKNNILFWIFTVIQVYIFWIILFKPQVIFMDTDVLLELPYEIIKVVKIYSLEERIKYLYEYFEYYNVANIDKDYLRYILRQIDFTCFINENITLQDIQVYIKLFVDTYNLQEIYIMSMKQQMAIYNSIVSLNPWYDFLRNSIIILASFSTVTNTYYYYSIFYDIMMNTGYMLMKQGFILIKYLRGF